MCFKYAWDNDKYNNDEIVIENDHCHAGTPAEFPGININNEDDGPTIELFDNTDEERVLLAANKTGIFTRGTNSEGVTTVVDLIDDYESNGRDDNESNIPSLIDIYSSDDADDDHNDVAGNEGVIDHIPVTENIDFHSQAMVMF